MPFQKAAARAERDRRQGKSASTQAGEFVREEIERIRAGKHGARSASQAIAIGLAMARKAGVPLPPPPGAAPPAKAKSGSSGEPSRLRSRASLAALQREPRGSVSHAALSRQARESAARRGPGSRKKAAAKAVRTKSKMAKEKSD